jgi:hypothetical protein
VSNKEDKKQQTDVKAKKVRPKIMNINKAHQKLGHISERMLKVNAQRDNWVLTGKLHH